MRSIDGAEPRSEGTGIWGRNRVVGLAHTRLAILDLSDAAAQPMQKGADGAAMVYNGEIYNYQEVRKELQRAGCSVVSSGDSEVLYRGFHVWSDDVFRRILGMFAVAFWDHRGQVLRLARDQFGIKPLYWGKREERFAFASTPGAVLKLLGGGAKVEPDALFQYLKHGITDVGRTTLFKGVQQVLPGHQLTFDGENVLETPYADDIWSTEASRRSESFKDAVSCYRDLFFESVRLHLRSDVTLGVTLSGGIDSSSILASMRRLTGEGRELAAVSFVPDDPRISEEHWIRTAASATGAKVHFVRGGTVPTFDDLDELLRSQGEPVASSSMFAQYLVYRRASELGIKVMLDGQGADEVLGGYPLHLAAEAASALREGRAARSLGIMGSAWAHSGLGGVKQILGRVSQSYFGASLPGVRDVPKWINRDWFLEREVNIEPHGQQAIPASFQDAVRFSATYSSLPRLLRYGDRNSMRWSVESRVPFLYPPLIDYLSQLPPEYLIGGAGLTKRIHRAAMADVVPQEILSRRDKVGFVAPESLWLSSWKGPVRRVLEESADGWGAIASDYLLNRLDSGGPEVKGNALWRAVNVMRWGQLYDVQG